MRELSELYLTRREFLKGLVTVGAVAGTAGLSGCLEYIKPKTPKPTVTLSPTQIKQKEWIERYNKAYGANLTLADLPLPAERAVHQLKMYEGVTDFKEPVIDGSEYLNKWGKFIKLYSGFEEKIRDGLDLLKEKNYLDYVYVSKNSRKIRYSGEKGSGATDEDILLIGSDKLEGIDPQAGMNDLKYSAITTAGGMVHEATHLEIEKKVDDGIISGNPYEWKLGGMGPEILAFKAEGECYRTLGININVEDYVREMLKLYK